MTVPRRLLALVCALAALAIPAAMTAPAVAAGNKIINDCQTHGQLTHPYTVKQLRHALAVMPATVKQYTSCFDVIQSALVSARKNGGRLPKNGTGGGSSFLPTWLIIVIVVVVLAAVTFGALAIRRRRTGGEGLDDGPADSDGPGGGGPREPGGPGGSGSSGEARTRVMPSIPAPDEPARVDPAEEPTRADPGEEPTRADDETR